MATTSPDNIWTQDSADNYDLVIDAAATAASVQAALTARANSYKGTTAQRTAFTATAPEGTTWADTNGDKTLWIKQGASWQGVWSGANTISIGGVRYQASGVFPSLPAYTLTAAAPVYYAAISVARPFVAPSGWGFVPYVARTFRFVSIAIGDPAAATLQINYTQFVTPAVDTNLAIGWRLTPIT